MLPVQISKPDTADFYRCQDQNTSIAPGKLSESDATLKENIYHAFWQDEVLRMTEYAEIDAYVKNGAVYLHGHIVSATSQSRVISAIRAIPGILKIENNLVLDDKLTLEVASALGKLEHTYHCKFFTGAAHGVISLNGTVDTENIRAEAEQCAANNPNVRGVINHVQVAGHEEPLPEQLFLQPVIGQTIYFLDGISGVVQQIVMNPNNRLVSHLVLQAQFSNPKQKDHPAQDLARTVVMPMHVMRYLTKSSGFLTIKSTDTTHYEDFNPLYFVTPQLDWTLPYPYCPGDILFKIASSETENQIMVDPDLEQLSISAQPTSPLKQALPVDILASWEDDGGQIVQSNTALD